MKKGNLLSLHRTSLTYVDQLYYKILLTIRRLCTRLRIDGLKTMSHCFSWGKQAIKFASVRNRGQVGVYSGQQKIRNFHGKLWVEVIIVTFLDAVATVDVFTVSKNDVSLVDT